MKKVSFDIDGVLADYLTPAIELARQMYPTKVPPGYKNPLYNLEGILTYPEWTSVMEKFHKTENLWLNLSPLIPNIDELRTYVKTTSDSVFFITSRAKTPGLDPKTQTIQWFTKLGIPAPNVYISPASEKWKFMRMLGIQFSTDDLYTTIDSCNEVPKHKAFLFDASWNLHVPDMPRVRSVEHFVRTVRILGG